MSEIFTPRTEAGVYAKVFRSMWDGSLRGQPDEQLVMIYLVVHAGADGEVEVHPAKVGDDTGMGEGRVRAALAKLEADDPESRSAEEGGRRLVRLDEHRDWGWRVVNHAFYRGIRDAEDRKRQQREATARWRAKQRTSADQRGNPEDMTPITADLREHSEPRSAQAEAEAEAEAEELKPTHLAENPAVGVMITLKEEWNEAFREDFWKLYPRKIKRPTAERAWQALRPSGLDQQPVLADEICAGVERWIAYWREHETPEDKVPYPATFLNGRQFEDYPS